jgi:hypothetical protein
LSGKIIFALIQELSQCETRISLEQVLCHLDVLMNGGGKQGASETPALWNKYLDTAWQRADIKFRQSNLGFVLANPIGPPSLLTGLFWADDMYLIAADMKTAQKMFEILSIEILALSLSWKKDSLEVMCNIDIGANTSVFWPCCFGDLEIISKEKLEILGTSIDKIGSTVGSMNHRAQQLFSSWATSREHYVSRRIPLLLRVQKFYDVLARVFAFGAGGWNLKQTDLKRIDHWERIILRQILGRHRFADEPWHLYQQRLKHKT